MNEQTLISTVAQLKLSRSSSTCAPKSHIDTDAATPRSTLRLAPRLKGLSAAFGTREKSSTRRSAFAVVVDSGKPALIPLWLCDAVTDDSSRADLANYEDITRIGSSLPTE